MHLVLHMCLVYHSCKIEQQIRGSYLGETNYLSFSRQCYPIVPLMISPLPHYLIYRSRLCSDLIQAAILFRYHGCSFLLFLGATISQQTLYSSISYKVSPHPIMFPKTQVQKLYWRSSAEAEESFWFVCLLFYFYIPTNVSPFFLLPNSFTPHLPSKYLSSIFHRCFSSDIGRLPMDISQQRNIKLQGKQAPSLLLSWLRQSSRRKGSRKAGIRVRGRPCSHYQKSHKKATLHSCNICTEGLGQSQADFLVVYSVSACQYEPSLFGSVGFLCCPFPL